MHATWHWHAEDHRRRVGIVGKHRMLWQAAKDATPALHWRPPPPADPAGGPSEPSSRGSSAPGTPHALTPHVSAPGSARRIVPGSGHAVTNAAGGGLQVSAGDESSMRAQELAQEACTVDPLKHLVASFDVTSPLTSALYLHFRLPGGARGGGAGPSGGRGAEPWPPHPPHRRPHTAGHRAAAHAAAPRAGRPRLRISGGEAKHYS